MKLKLSYAAIVTSMLLLQACGGGSMISGGEKDKDPLNPAAEVVTPPEVPHPSESAAVMTTDAHFIYGATNKTAPVLLRGVNLLYGAAPDKRFDGIQAIKDVGSSVVRLQVTKSTTDLQLEAALAKVVALGMTAVVTLTEPTIRCTESNADLMKAVDEQWLVKWMPTLAQDRFQGSIMLNIADGWGPNGIFNLESTGYSEYIDTYKALIRKFRSIGFKVPLVIDAPNCGQDYFAFLNGRADELMAADKQKNLVLGVQADGGSWNSSDKIIAATTYLDNAKVPYIMTSFAGSDTGDKPIDQLDLMKKAAGDGALVLNLPWTTDKDSVAYAAPLGKVLDLRGASVGVNVYAAKTYLEKIIVGVAKQYVPTGKMSVALYLKDSDGNSLRAGIIDAKSLNGDAWNAIKFIVKDVDPSNLLNGSKAFNLKSVVQVGFQVLANGKAADVKANIKFDNLAIYPGVPPMYEANFTSSNDEWDKGWGNVEVGNAGGALTIKPTGSGDFGFGLQGWKAPSMSRINLNKTVDVTLRMFVPADYAADNFSMKVFGQFGSGWETWLDESVQTAQIKYGEWSDVKVTLKFNEKGKDISVFQAIGIQMAGFTGAKSSPIKIDSVTFQDPAAKATVTVTATQYTIKFNTGVEGFADNGWDGSKGTLTQSNGELVLTPNWAGGHNLAIGKNDFNSIQEIDFSGPFKVKAKLFIPATYASVAAKSYFQFYFQDGSWNWIGVWVGNLDQFKLGEWNDVEVNVDLSKANRTARPNTFGFQIGGDDLSTAQPAGNIKLDNIEFIGNKEVETSEPLVAMDFESKAQVDAFKFDFAGGSFTESSVALAKMWGNKIMPFSWIAATWFGSATGYEALDLSTSIKTVALTPRGEHVVNGAYGIKATNGGIIQK